MQKLARDLENHLQFYHTETITENLGSQSPRVRMCVFTQRYIYGLQDKLENTYNLQSILLFNMLGHFYAQQKLKIKRSIYIATFLFFLIFH